MSAARSESGQGVTEYIVILAVIIVACIAFAGFFRDQISSTWDSISASINGITAK